MDAANGPVFGRWATCFRFAELTISSTPGIPAGAGAWAAPLVGAVSRPTTTGAAVNAARRMSLCPRGASGLTLLLPIRAPSMQDGSRQCAFNPVATVVVHSVLRNIYTGSKGSA